ncbi:MAG: MlaE family lipid ABC transporter permease subunit [Pseudolabrys sp.]|nr:MlaE family lipid ABC transporter permease subunit [Pseudolabrys sp.]MDP2295964.1 MlaE family lipid ABC transporter permease subunit [Pseudolabrys sp.]
MTAATLQGGHVNDGGLDLAAAGSWTAEHARALEPLVDKATHANETVRRIVIDVTRVERLDTYGAWLIERTMRVWISRGVEAEIVGLSDSYGHLFKKVRAGAGKLTPLVRRGNSITATLESVGRTMMAVVADILLFTQMAGSLVVAFLRVVAHPTKFRFTSMVNHLERVGWHAVPIILLITFLIGSILAQQGIFHFRTFGADIYVVDMVGVLVLREVGVLIVCIMVAGRSGSAYTAELGSMKMREEVDALRTMGFDPVEVLILPRIFALIITVPILTFLGSMAALYGGGVVAWLYGGIDPQVFLARLHESISVKSFAVGMIKAPFMAIVIGLVACVEGLQVKGSAESLGAKTTDSVVKSIFLVIVLDGAFAIFFASIGV